MPFLYQNPIYKDRRRALRNASTDAERKLWSCLRSKQIDGLRFARQYSVGAYVLDFYCCEIRLAIEADGSQHGTNDGRINDEIRTQFLKEHGIRIVRFWNNEILQNIEGVVAAIREAVAAPTIPLHPPYPKGEI